MRYFETIFYCGPEVVVPGSNTIAFGSKLYITKNIEDNVKDINNLHKEEFKKDFPELPYILSNTVDITDQILAAYKKLGQQIVPEKNGFFKRLKNKLFKKSDQNMYLTANPVCKCCEK